VEQYVALHPARDCMGISTYSEACESRGVFQAGSTFQVALPDPGVNQHWPVQHRPHWPPQYGIEERDCYPHHQVSTYTFDIGPSVAHCWSTPLSNVRPTCPCNRTVADTRDVRTSLIHPYRLPLPSILIETATLQPVAGCAASWLQSYSEFTSALRSSPFSSSYQQSWPQRKSSQLKWGLGYCCGECSSTCSCSAATIVPTRLN